MAIEELDATELATEIRAGRISVRESIVSAIERIEATRGLNAVVHERFDQALAEVERGLPAGPLTGVPFLVKNLDTQVAGLPLTHGSRLFAEQVSEIDSHLVSLYRRAGMVILGSTNSPEFGRNASTEPLLYGPTKNPWNTEYSPGGSSGGSAAAVVAGVVPVAHATDGGGSIRLPAAMCGLVGLKPSRGRVSHWPNPTVLSAPHSVAHVVTRTVRDSALLLDISAHRRAGDPLSGGVADFLGAASRPPGRLRIGWSTTAPDAAEADSDVAAAVEQAARLFADLGHEVDQAQPTIDAAKWHSAFPVMMRAELVALINRRLAELGRELQPGDVEPFTEVLYRNPVTIDAYLQAQRDVVDLSWQVGAYFEHYDLWLSPTVGARVPRLGALDTSDTDAMRTWGPIISRFTSLFNLSGHPAISVPFGRDSNGLPIGIQLVAEIGYEAKLLSVAAQLEDAQPWPQIVTDRSFR